MGLSYEKVNEIMNNATRENITPTPPKGLKKMELFFWKVVNDFPWYAENFLKIRNKKNQLIPFQLNESQIKVEAVDKYCRENNIFRRYIILKARQEGMSTYTEGKIFQDTSNNKFVRSMIVAHEEKASTNLFNMSKLFYDELDEAIQPMRRFNNGKILSFENPSNDESVKKLNPGLRSNITIATAGTGEVGRSATPSNLHISELAFFPNASITMTGLLQGVPDNKDILIIYESTANGVGNYFHTQWTLAMKGESDFVPIFLPWYIDKSYSKEFESETQKQDFIDKINQKQILSDGRKVNTYEYELKEKFNLTYEQLFWRTWTIKNKCEGDVEIFNQEYPSTPEEAFIVSGRPKFNIGALRKYSSLVKPPLKTGYLFDRGNVVDFIEDAKGYISIWKEPEEGKYYCIGADVAEGGELGDYSCGLVGDEDFDVVAKWYGHIDPDLFGDELVKLAKYYNQAYIGCEANNHGLTTLKRIQYLEYWNIYYQKTYDRMSDQLTSKLGWTTSPKTKPLMIDKLAEYIREMYIGIYDELIISELFTYIIEDNGSTNAQYGCHDDTVMALAVLLQVLLEGRNENYEPEIVKNKKVRKILNNEIVDDLFEKKIEKDEIAD